MTEEKEIKQPAFKEDDLGFFKDEVAKLRNNIASKELSIFKSEREIEEDIPQKNMQLLLNELEILRVKATEKIEELKKCAEPPLETDLFKAELDLKKVELDIEESIKGKEMGLPSLNKRASIANFRKGLKEDKMNKNHYERLLLQAKKTLGIKS